MNPYDSGRFCTESIESAAKRYKTLGFSIIPLNGAQNPQQPKLPLIKWARFQHTYPSDEQLNSWFHDQPDLGIGIVCGRISRLIVLDFDTLMGVSEFRHLCPDLVETFTVLSGTRKLPHFYYRMPQGKLVPTSAYPGVDLRGEGSYVVVPPTRVGDAAWTIENDAPIREVSEFDLRRIMRFLSSQKEAIVEQPVPINLRSEKGVSELRHVDPDTDLTAYYHQHVGNGRNHALFQTAMMARDLGMPEALFSLKLASVHATEPGNDHEAYETRYAEAIRTIASAYSRPARPKTDAVKGLSNAVREWFLGKGLANIARVLDGFYSIGMKADELFTELEACQKLAALKIGRRSIMAALKVLIGDWELFEVVNFPLNPPFCANAAKGSENLNHSCEMSRGAKRIKNSRGRPARLYRLPSPEFIANKLGVSSKLASDALPNPDFSSPRAYRQALHSELLTRRPGHYGRSWLSERLGVSRWTVRRYEKAAGIEVQPAYSTQTLSWASASLLPEKITDSPKGVFIEAKDGKRYPALRGLALRLMKQRQSPVLRHQQGNFYRAKKEGVGTPTPYSVQQSLSAQNVRRSESMSVSEAGQHRLPVGTPTPFDPISIKRLKSGGVLRRDEWIADAQPQTEKKQGVGVPTPPTVEPSFWLCPECLNFHITVNRPTDCSRCGTVSQWEILSPSIWRDAQALKQWWHRRYKEHQQLKHQQATGEGTQQSQAVDKSANELTQKLHDQIPDLSFANARNLVREFSGQLIEKALTVIKGRNKLRSPAGFLVSFLRSESRLLSSNNKYIDAKEDKKRESSVDWLRHLAQSKYLNFISNVEDLLSMDFDPSPRIAEA